MNRREIDLLSLVKHNPEFRRKFLGILKDTDLQEKVQKHSSTLIAKVPYVIPPIPDDFHELNPGTYMWIQFWTEHPEKQAEMLEWRIIGKSHVAI